MLGVLGRAPKESLFTEFRSLIACLPQNPLADFILEMRFFLRPEFPGLFGRYSMMAPDSKIVIGAPTPIGS